MQKSFHHQQRRDASPPKVDAGGSLDRRLSPPTADECMEWGYEPELANLSERGREQWKAHWLATHVMINGRWEERIPTSAERELRRGVRNTLIMGAVVLLVVAAIRVCGGL